MPAKILVPRAELEPFLTACTVDLDQPYVDVIDLIARLQRRFQATEHTGQYLKADPRSYIERVIDGEDFGSQPVAKDRDQAEIDAVAERVQVQGVQVQPWDAAAEARAERVRAEDAARADLRARQELAQRRLASGEGGPGGEVAGMPPPVDETAPRRYAYDGLVGDRDLDDASE